jgi:serine/threonine-protein kinase HipA
MLCAIDGHAKNFSVFIEAGGRYRLTPLYDVLSAFPVLGRRAGKLSPDKVKMAMAVEGKNRHYVWTTIRRRHWEETARRCGLGAFWPRIVDELLERTPAALAAVRSELPANFPDPVADPILKGLAASARVLAG